jgi:hypothetical protein
VIAEVSFVAAVVNRLQGLFLEDKSSVDDVANGPAVRTVLTVPVLVASGALRRLDRFWPVPIRGLRDCRYFTLATPWENRFFSTRSLFDRYQRAQRQRIQLAPMNVVGGLRADTRTVIFNPYA